LKTGTDIHREKVMDLQDEESKKKPYATPQLVVYGDIREVTQTVGNKGALDGPAGGSMDKTS
jgi:hypothetical protein